MGENEKLPSVLAKFVAEGFTSMPVLDEKHRYRGHLDILDMVWFAVNLHGYDATAGASDHGADRAKALQTWKTFLSSERKFRNTRVFDVMKKPIPGQPDPFH